jgi:hypothetical protein
MNFNASTFSIVIETAKLRAASSPRWIKAIDRAAAALLDGSLIVTTLRNGALITSKNGTYRVNGRCACSAAKHGDDVCYHKAAARLVEMYEAAEVEAVKAAPRSPSITRSIETNRAGIKLAVTRCDGWMI